MLALLVTGAVAVWLTRPYSFDFARNALWSATEGRAFVRGTVVSGDAHIAYLELKGAASDASRRPPCRTRRA